MKKLAALFLLALIILISSCKKSGGGGSGGGNNNFTPNCTRAAANFTADVLPIFSSACSQGSCHNTGSINGPGALTNYNEINAAKARIRTAVISGFMPRNSTLTAAQKNSIICRIDSGAPNN
ncbi:MAG: hypothetical protein K2X48_11755 [Chitinophagaceae bacterium]|nr:hypothetical protein [Chitinophagaceae bacterium]